MQTVERSNSVEVVGGGRYYGSFPSRSEAEAYIKGYRAALTDAQSIVKTEANALVLAIKRVGE